MNSLLLNVMIVVLAKMVILAISRVFQIFEIGLP